VPRAAAPEVNPYAAPSLSAGMATAQTPLQGGALDLGVILTKTWDLYIKQKKLGWCILAFFIVYLISQTGTFLAGKLLEAVFGLRMILVAVPVFLIVIIAALVLQQWLDLGMRMFMLRIARGESPDISQIFRGHPYLLRSSIFLILMVLLFAGLVLALVMVPSMISGVLLRKPEIGAVIGWILWAIPVVYVFLIFSQVQFLFVDRNAGLFDAMRMSMQLTRGRLPILLLIYFVLLLAGFSGVLAIVMLTEIAGTSSPLALTVAPIATFPFAVLGMTITYLYLTQQTNELDEE
jgi:hypothetical protein